MSGTAIIFVAGASAPDAAREAKLAELERLVQRVKTRQGGHGDYTREKQERSQESEEALYAEFQKWIAARRQEQDLGWSGGTDGQ